MAAAVSTPLKVESTLANPPSEHTTSSTGLDRLEQPTAAEARRVGWGFISLYTLAFISTSLLFLAPLLVTLALKVNSLVGIDQAPSSLAVVTGTGALLAMVGNPFFGKLSDRTASRLGMRRPWMVAGLLGGSVGILMVALAPASRSSSSAGASPSCSSTHCSPPWWRCCRTRSRPRSAAWSPASSVSVCRSRR
jgi:MFS family permease